MVKLKEHFEQTAENIKQDTDVEIKQHNLEFKEKLKIMSNDKFNNATDKLDMALQEEIILVKKRISDSYQHNVNIKSLNQKPKSKLCIECSDRDFISE